MWMHSFCIYLLILDVLEYFPLLLLYTSTPLQGKDFTIKYLLHYINFYFEL